MAKAEGDGKGLNNSKDMDIAAEKRWLQQKEREVQEMRVRESKQQSIQQRRDREVWSAFWLSATAS